MPVGQKTPRELILEAKAMLDRGAGMNEIRQRLGLSWNTVDAIRKGRYASLHQDVLKAKKCPGCNRRMLGLNRRGDNCLACKAERQLAKSLANQRHAIGR